MCIVYGVGLQTDCTERTLTRSLDRFFLAIRFLILFLSYFFVSGPCARLSWPSRQLLSAR